MKSALNEYFIKSLYGKGFVGDFPHFRRIGLDRVDLLSIVFDKWGGAFLLEISYANFSHEDSNLISHPYSVDWESLDVFKTKRRKRLPNDREWITFCDLVKVNNEFGEKVYSLTETQKKAFLKNIPEAEYEIIYQAGQNVYKLAAEMAVKYLSKADEWWEEEAYKAKIVKAKPEEPVKEKPKKKSAKSFVEWFTGK